MSNDSGEHNCIKEFKPIIKKLDSVHNDLLLEFDAGDENFSFNCFIYNEAKGYAESGQGATYIVLNETKDTNEIIHEEVVSYYTLMSTAIPYEDKIKLDPEDSLRCGDEYDVQICGISAVEIKMFAVSKKNVKMYFMNMKEKFYLLPHGY